MLIYSNPSYFMRQLHKLCTEITSVSFKNRTKESLWPFEFNNAVNADRGIGNGVDEHVGWVHIF